jgi:hypothetical protein
MKTGDLVNFNHHNHKRTGMKGIVVAKKADKHCSEAVSVLWATGEIINEWPTYLEKVCTQND